MEQIMYGYYYHSISDLYILGIILIIFGVANLLGHGRTPGTYKSYYYVLRYRRRNGLIRLISGVLLIIICALSKSIGKTTFTVMLLLLTAAIIVFTIINEKSIK